MNLQNNNRELLFELLAERALFGLDESDSRILSESLPMHPDVDAECMDRVAAMLHVSSLGSEELHLPSNVADKIRASMPKLTVPAEFDDVKTNRTEISRVLDETDPDSEIVLPDSQRGWNRALTFSGWVAAAALLAVLLFPSVFRSATIPPAMTQLRDQLIATSGDIIKRDWTATEDAAAREASGLVVWSNEAQEGYMTFRGLQPNDAKVFQYQLWIFDDEQEHPIDGGVFDMPTGNNDVIIPIAAKIRVAKPTVFAVTIEKPGGVVVSKKERIALLAAQPTP